MLTYLTACPSPAYQWLQGALIEGRIEQGVFLWRGGLKPYGDPGQTDAVGSGSLRGVVELSTRLADRSQVQSQLRLNDRRIDIWSPQGEVAGLTMNTTAVALDIGAGATGSLCGRKRAADRGSYCRPCSVFLHFRWLHRSCVT